jgi:spermidine/putrescine-binding protein
MKRNFAVLAFVLCFGLPFGGCKKQPPTLSLLVWEGYADPSFVRPFEQSHKCKISASYMGSSDELVAKLRGGSASNYDVISPSSDVATMIASAGLAAPLDLSKFPSYLQLSERLREMPLVRVNGNVYGVPFTWGPNPLLFDTRAFPTPPDSWTVLWSPDLKNKISEELNHVKKKLIELKPNIRKMWSTGGELTNLFENHEVVAAMGWPLMTNQLRKANFPIGETIPKENTTGWIDHLMITSASEHKELAAEFLEYMIETKTQKAVADVTGYDPANPQAAQFMTEDQRKSLHLDNVDLYMTRIYFWQQVPRRDKYNEIWNEVKAAQ